MNSRVGEIEVRDAEPEDAPAILRVRARTWRSAYAHIVLPEDEEWLGATFREIRYRITLGPAT